MKGIHHNSSRLLLVVLYLICSIHLNAQVQKGHDIDGETTFDNSGQSVCMPDSNTIAIGANKNDGNGTDAGHVRIFTWNFNSGNWVQKGNDIDGENANDESGVSISMPTLNIIAIGAPGNSGNGYYAGHVRIYQWNSTSSVWIQKGDDIDGEAAYDRSGYSVSMPDSNTIAIGATNNSGNGKDAGHVRIFIWDSSNGKWIQKGNDIDAEAASNSFGYAVSMPDSNTIAIGATGNSGSSYSAGHVRIYNWNSAIGIWVQKGSDIDGEAAYDNSGNSVCMPDSNTVAIGAPGNDGNGSYAGHVRIYSWNSVARIWIQKGGDIDGEKAGDLSGLSVSMPNSNTLAIGAPYNNGTDTSAGHVRIYIWNGSSWVKKGVDIDGESVHNLSGVSISMPDVSTIAIGALGNSDAGLGAGHVRIYSPPCTNTSSSISPTACNSYTSPSGNYTWTNSSTYVDTIPNAAGFDSIITVNLNINNSTSSSINVSACNSYRSPSGNHTWTISGPYLDTIPNSAGCDSIISLNLTINNSTSSSINVSACTSYASPSGNHTWTVSGNYLDTIPNSAGCDSIITVNLNINTSSSSSINVSACTSYASPSGNYTWTASGTYMDIIPSTVGCDSIITITLTIITVDVRVTNTSPILTANATGATYQWLDCNKFMVVISGETNISFIATLNGSYAVEITKNGCTDTSDCEAVNNIDIKQNDFGNTLLIYPNPTDGNLALDLGSENTCIVITVRNTLGQIVNRLVFNSTSKLEFNILGEAGVYFIEINADNKRTFLKILKE